MLSRFTFAYQKWIIVYCMKCMIMHQMPQRWTSKKMFDLSMCGTKWLNDIAFQCSKIWENGNLFPGTITQSAQCGKMCGIECFKNNRLVWISQSIIAKAGLSLKPHFMATLFPLSLSQNWIWNIFKQLLICFYATKNECVLMWKRVFMSNFFSSWKNSNIYDTFIERDDAFVGEWFKCSFANGNSRFCDWLNLLLITSIHQDRRMRKKTQSWTKHIAWKMINLSSFLVLSI